MLYIQFVMWAPMDARITQFTLVVKNQAQALEYYTKKVGFEKKTDFTPPGSYRWVTVGLRGRIWNWLYGRSGQRTPMVGRGTGSLGVVHQSSFVSTTAAKSSPK